MSINEHGIYFLTGSLRSGKGLTAVSKIQEHLIDNKRVVTNMDIKIENLLPSVSKNLNLTRIPDKPNIDDLEAIGLGYEHNDPEHYDESKFGLLVLDELATFFNSRTWNDKGRKPIIDWLLMSGKKRWILMLTIQDLELLDKQIKASLASQYIVHCKSMSKYPIPLISPIFKLFFGKPLTLPKSYLGVVKIGMDHNAIVNDRWLHFGTQLYAGYNTSQVYLDRDHPSSTQICSMLSPWHLKGRYEIVKDWNYYRNRIKDKIEYLLAISILALLTSTSTLAFTFIKEPEELILKVDKLTTYIEHLDNFNKSINSELLKEEKEICQNPNAYQNYTITAGFKKQGKTMYKLTDGVNYVLMRDLINEEGMLISSKGYCDVSIKTETCSYNFTCRKRFFIQPPLAQGGMDKNSDSSDNILGNLSLIN